ncbi:unnamed protein product [Macrosiphum euphorbiae]|uniref:CCHC-type domain-containing protein n=2 Tax=Macrosiphum euphorbiae TaxID=13131 RepID=A0AAV0VW56_9HEMI|nr:unnamed protein product [Macrosiphum euphorbiae]
MSGIPRTGFPPTNKPPTKNNISKTSKTTSLTNTTITNNKLPVPNKNNNNGPPCTPHTIPITQHTPLATKKVTVVKAADKPLITAVSGDNDHSETRHTIADKVYDQQSSHINNQYNSANYPNKTFSFASVTANDKLPTREQALVFNSIDGIRQIDYILAIGKIVSPKHIIYTSRISNNRFCIFLSSKEILETLLEKNNTITVNEHIIQIRRLINPAKKIIISNVCPSIPNQSILNALKNINITPLSQISYIRAGINHEGYEHILSFRRQMFINHEDVIKLPGSLTIINNQTQFRIFLTDETITCFICKSTGHTSKSCNKQIATDNFISPQIHRSPLSSHNQNNTIDESLLEDMLMPESPSINEIQSQNNTDLATGHQTENIPGDNTNTNSSPPNPSPPSLEHSHGPLPSTPQQQRHPSEDGKPPKRHLSDSSSQEANNITFNNSISTLPNQHSDTTKKIQKKVKVRSRSNSSSRKEDKILECLTSAEEIFLNTDVTMLQFKHVLENYTNKNINIHNLCKEIDSDIPSIMKLIDEIRPKITKTFLKTHLTKLGNLLFQASPPQDS